MTTDNFCFYLQNRQIQASQTGGQQYSDTSPFSIPWLDVSFFRSVTNLSKKFEKVFFLVISFSSPGSNVTKLFTAVIYEFS